MQQTALQGFVEELTKIGDVMGIPDRSVTHPIPTVKEPKTWEFGVHEHHAEKAGKHFDLRLGDPSTGHAHSWAMRYWPAPGETRLAVLQPTHTIEYMDFKGTIPSGYGAGKVNLHQRGKAEVISSSKGHVRFNVYTGQKIEEYLLRDTGNGWMLKNFTPTKEDVSAIKLEKPKYREVKPSQLDADRPDTVWQAKIDGAHVLYDFPESGRTPNIYSCRPTVRDQGIIEHTARVPGALTRSTPGALKGSLLRGELYAVGPDGRALPASSVGGILNAGVWKSREKQEVEGKLVPVVFDVVRFKGKDVEHLPYSQKRELLEKAVKAAPWLSLPRTAEAPEEKRRLFEEIKKGHEPSTKEGLIEWHLDKSGPTKAKFKQDQDVYVKDIFSEKSKRGLAGGFSFSLTQDGPVAGRVGTGMSHALKKDLLDNPDRYVGLKARIEAQRAPVHHAPRSPSFIGWHLDQKIPETVKMAGHAEQRLEQRTDVSPATLRRLQKRLAATDWPAQVHKGYVPLFSKGVLNGYAAIKTVGPDHTPVIATVLAPHMTPQGQNVEHILQL